MNVKLTGKQTEALLSATYNPNARGDGMGAYVIMSVHHITRKSLHDKGLMYGHYYLTRKGTEVLAALSGNEVDMYGMEWREDSHGEYIAPAPVVSVQGEYVEPTTMVDLDGNVIPYDAFGSMAIQEARARIENGGCVGLCAVGTGCAHCDEQYGPEASQTDAESVSPAMVDTLTPNGKATFAYYANNGMSDIDAFRKAADMCGTVEKETQEESSMETQTVATVNVVQAYMGSNGMNHYHAPGCRDIEREAKRHGARKGMGVYEFPFSSVAAIIEHEYSDCNDGNAFDMVAHANDDFDGLKIMSCLRDSLPMGDIEGMPVEFKGGRWTLGDAPLDSERCTVCEVFGNVADNSTDIDGKHVCGYCVDNGRTFATLDTHSLTFYVETEGAGTKYECADCGSIDTRARFAEYVCEGDQEDAGFVETDSTDDYAIVSRLSTGAGFHTVEESRTATPESATVTGTTHHTLDSEGKTWERFEHVLSVGDVVKVVGSQGVYEVHCLIPGLPVVYVLGTQGEPFPVPATDVYAL